jgi:hypothetical protein
MLYIGKGPIVRPFSYTYLEGLTIDLTAVTTREWGEGLANLGS